MKYELSFVEEAIMNPDPKYDGYIAGRVEILKPDEMYSSEEVRFFTNKIKEFNEFRELWDLETVYPILLSLIKDNLEKDFNKGPE